MPPTERSLGKLGGLIHRMPWVAWLALLGVIASAGLPPLSGFVSEWLLLQGFLFSPGLPHSWLNMIVPVAAAVVALVAALAGFAMVKFFGIIFLGQMREPALKDAHDAGVLERIGLVWLALMTLLLGMLPVDGDLADSTPRRTSCSAPGLADQVREHGWWMLAPIAPERASYQPLVFLAVIVALGAARPLAGAPLLPRPRAPHPGLGLRLLVPEAARAGHRRRLQPADPPHLRALLPHGAPPAEHPRRSSRSIRVKVEDHFWHWLYLPVARLADAASGLIVGCRAAASPSTCCTAS